MPPPAPAVRLDRTASYQIVLGESISQGNSAAGTEPSGYSSFKYNHKPSSFVLNPSAPTLVPTSDAGANAYALTFTPPTTSTQITYTGAAVPSSKPGYFLLFHPSRKLFTLERLDASFVFNAGVYSKLHPPIAITDPSEGSAENDDEREADDVYDYRSFLGRTTAAEEKRQKRLGALKRAGKEVVDLPEGEDDDDPDVVVIPDPVLMPPDEGSDMDAPGESDDDDFPTPAHAVHIPAPAPPPPPPPPPKVPQQQQQKKKPAPKPKKKKPLAVVAAQLEEIVLPDRDPLPVPIDSDDEELEFSDDEEEVPLASAAAAAAAAAAPAVATTPEVPADDDGDFDFDIGKELEEALGSRDDGVKLPSQTAGSGVVFDDEESDEDEMSIPVPVAAGDGAPKSLREMFGGTEEEEEEDSESEEE